MTESVDAVAFAVLATCAIGGAVLMLVSRNVVHAAFWLLGVMLTVAGVFALLSAEFLALVQVLVYAGAVSVLMLFVIMLSLRRREDAVRTLDLSPLVAVLVLVFGVTFYAALAADPPPPLAMIPDVTPDVAAFGRELFTTWVLPFELASLVLLVALVGAVWWAGGDGE
jgi:NADH-quinone oxidoreductase subunit J